VVIVAHGISAANQVASVFPELGFSDALSGGQMTGSLKVNQDLKKGIKR